MLICFVNSSSNSLFKCFVDILSSLFAFKWHANHIQFTLQWRSKTEVFFSSKTLVAFVSSSYNKLTTTNYCFSQFRHVSRYSQPKSPLPFRFYATFTISFTPYIALDISIDVECFFIPHYQKESPVSATFSAPSKSLPTLRHIFFILKKITLLTFCHVNVITPSNSSRHQSHHAIKVIAPLNHHAIIWNPSKPPYPRKH